MPLVILAFFENMFKSAKQLQWDSNYVGVAMPLTITATINVTPAGKIYQIEQKKGFEIDGLI